jgi:Fe-S-cluster-containing hydrogenase component 2
MPDSLKTRGYLTEADVLAGPGVPSAQRRAKGKVACIECLQEIPCNPCETSCKFGAITVGSDITNLPRLDEDKCTGCTTCLPACPGQAIFIIDESMGDGRAQVSMPYEFRPLPREGDEVVALDRTGAELGPARVVKVRGTEKMDQTVMVTLDLPQEWSMKARALRLK